MDVKKRVVLAASVAGLLAAVSLSQRAMAEMDKPTSDNVPCYGINKCKGMGECGGKGHSCSGKNECAGQGYVELSKEKCMKIQGGRLEE